LFFEIDWFDHLKEEEKGRESLLLQISSHLPNHLPSPSLLQEFRDTESEFERGRER